MKIKTKVPKPLKKDGEPITSISEMPSANEKIIHELAALNKTTVASVEAIISFVGDYTANIIRKGTMETVMLPHFGKIRPKKNKVLAISKSIQDKRSGRLDIYLALKGKKTKRPYEIIRGNGEQRDQAEQGLDIPDTGIEGTDNP